MKGYFRYKLQTKKSIVKLNSEVNLFFFQNLEVNASNSRQIRQPCEPHFANKLKVILKSFCGVSKRKFKSQIHSMKCLVL